MFYPPPTSSTLPFKTLLIISNDDGDNKQIAEIAASVNVTAVIMTYADLGATL